MSFAPDRVAMQDATAQMALLQFMTCGRSRTAVPTTVHCDHLILAKEGAGQDLATSNVENAEVFDFLQSISTKYGIGFGNLERVLSIKLFWKITLFPEE